MHARGVGHCDLTLENVLLATTPAPAGAEAGGAGAVSPALPAVPATPKLSDFGLAVALPPPGEKLPACAPAVGTTGYTAPGASQPRGAV